MRLTPLLLIACVALAGCDVDKSAKTGANDVHIGMAKQDNGGDRVSINIPGFDAKVSLPNLHLNTHLDLDGMKLAPDTDVKTVDVIGGKGKNKHGDVHIMFTNPVPPAALLAYYRRAVTDAGYTLTPATGDAALSAAKGDKAFAVALAPEHGGSRGTISVSGS